MDNPNMDTIEVKSGENSQPEENGNLTIGSSQHIEMQHIQMQPGMFRNTGWYQLLFHASMNHFRN